MYLSFRLFHPKQHLRIFFNLFSFPLSHFNHICSPRHIHQLPGQAEEGLTLPEDLPGQISWSFLKLYPFTQDHQQLLITPMSSARASFLGVIIIYNTYIMLCKVGVQYSKLRKNLSTGNRKVQSSCSNCCFVGGEGEIPSKLLGKQ